MSIKIILATANDMARFKKDLLEIMNEYSLLLRTEENGGLALYEKMKHYFDLNQAKILLALEDNKAVGYAQFFIKGNRRVHLNAIAVAAHCKNRGIGSKLVEAVEQSAKEYGVSEVELFCNESNLEARNFYAQHNYTVDQYVFLKEIF